MRIVRRVFAVGALSALVVGVVPSAGAQTPTVTSVIGSAEGLAVNLSVAPLVGDPIALTVGPTPTVALPPEGGAVSDAVASINQTVLGVGLTSGTLTTSAEGAVGPAGFATADSAVENLALSVIGALNILGAEAISAECSSDLDGVSGSSTLVGASVLGTALAVEPPPNTALVVPLAGVGEASLTLNRQIENADGSLSVTALAVEVDVSILDGVSVDGSLEISTATCGVVEGVEPPPAPPAPPGPPAPAPVVVTPTFTG